MNTTFDKKKQLLLAMDVINCLRQRLRAPFEGGDQRFQDIPAWILPVKTMTFELCL